MIKILPYLLSNKSLFFSNILISCASGLCFPFTGVILGKIIINLLQYPLDKSYYQGEAYKWVYIMLGLALAGALLQALALLTGALLG